MVIQCLIKKARLAELKIQCSYLFKIEKMLLGDKNQNYNGATDRN